MGLEHPPKEVICDPEGDFLRVLVPAQPVTSGCISCPDQYPLSAELGPGLHRRPRKDVGRYSTSSSIRSAVLYMSIFLIWRMLSSRGGPAGKAMSPLLITATLAEVSLDKSRGEVEHLPPVVTVPDSSPIRNCHCGPRLLTTVQVICCCFGRPVKTVLMRHGRCTCRGVMTRCSRPVLLIEVLNHGLASSRYATHRSFKPSAMWIGDDFDVCFLTWILYP